MSSLKKERSKLFLTALLLNLIYYSHLLFFGINNLGIYDSDYHLYLLEAVRKSIFEYQQFPYWDPWHMGGMPLLGNSQSPLSPLYFPILIFGTVAGAKITLFLLSIIGFISAFYLGRFIGLKRKPALAVAIVWSFNGTVASNIEGGWFLLSHLHLLPLAFLIFLKWRDDLRFSIPLGLLFSLIVFGGSPYPFVIGIVPLGLFALYYLLVDKNYKPLLFVMISGIVTILTTAIKLLPSVEWLSLYPRNLDKIIDGYSLKALFLSLIETGLSIDYPTTKLFSDSYIKGAVLYASSEYAMFVGALVLLLAITGLFYKNNYRPPAIFATLIIFLIMLGDYSPIPIWSLIRELPIYESMRVVSRFKFDFMLLLAIFTGFGVSFISSKVAREEMLSKILVFLIFVTLFVGNYSLLSNSFMVKPKSVELHFKNSGYFQIQKSFAYGKNGWLAGDGNYDIRGMYPYIKENIGVVLGYEPFDIILFTRGVGSPDYHGETFLASGSGIYPAKFDRWSPNRVDISWEEGRRGLLYLNQNYNKGWAVCEGSGREALNKGLVAIPVAKDESHTSLCYYPPQVGLWVSLLSLLIFGSYTVYLMRSKQFIREE